MLAKEFSKTPFILDHLARAGQGTPEQYDTVPLDGEARERLYEVFRCQLFLKEKPPFRDAKPLVRKTFDAFGPAHMVWGGFGHNMAEFREAQQTFDSMFDFASEQDRAPIVALRPRNYSVEGVTSTLHAPSDRILACLVNIQRLARTQHRANHRHQALIPDIAMVFNDRRLHSHDPERG